MASLLKISGNVIRNSQTLPVLERLFGSQMMRHSSDEGPRKATTPIGRLDEKWEGKNEQMEPQQAAKADDVYGPFPDNKNPETGEIGGPRGPEPTRYGDWERKGRVIDF